MHLQYLQHLHVRARRAHVRVSVRVSKIVDHGPDQANVRDVRDVRAFSSYAHEGRVVRVCLVSSMLGGF